MWELIVGIMVIPTLIGVIYLYFDFVKPLIQKIRGK